MKKRIFISLVVIVIMMVVPTILFANYDASCNCDPGGDPDVNAPIDGGLSILLAAGVGYGAKKMYNKKKKDVQE